LLIVPTLAVLVHLLIGLWWPDVDDDHRPTWAPLYQDLVRAPLWEELVWRGVVLGVLLRLLPARVAIVMSAAAFALIHFGQGYRGRGLVDTFAFGIVAGVIAWHTGRLWFAVAAHSAFNAGYIGLAVVYAVLLIWLAHIWRTDGRRLEQQAEAVAARLRHRPNR
jgi:membrane protease YdiL (CAAX protease family)